MKRILTTLSFALIAMLGVNGAIAQTTTSPEASSDTPKDGPAISVDKEVHDYGTIENGAEGSCVFTVTNIGNAPLVISLCKGSCGCTVPVCSKEPIAPGASSEITVKYDTKRAGPINKSVTITSNAVNNNSKVIRIKGTVKPKPTGGAPTVTGAPTVN